MTAMPADLDWKHADVFTGGVRLHVVRAGEGPAVLLVHGFPDFWFTWRYQIGALADAGYSVVAPDMRGYNTSDKPAGVAAYDIDELVGDLVGLVDRVGGGRAHLVGHDWGGIAAWYAASRHPDRFRSLVILNSPHPGAFRRDFFRTAQWLRSWYMFFFQLPGLPERLIRLGNWRSLEITYTRDVFAADAFAHGEIDEIKRALAEPGALTSAVHYYRAAFRRGLRRPADEDTRVDVPTLLVWGERDRFLGTSLATGLEQWVPNLRVHRIADAGHWVHIDRRDLVNRAMIDWFSSVDG